MSATIDYPSPDTITFNQHHLADDSVLEKIVIAASIESGETVLEIGPGTGRLTKKLIPLSRKLIAIEADKRMEQYLSPLALENSNLAVIYGDATRMKLPQFDRIAANIPFNITEPLIMGLLDQKFKSATLLVGRRFGDQIRSADCEEITRLGILSRAYFSLDYIADVPKEAFAPVPGTDCSIIYLEPIRKNELAKKDCRSYLIRCLWDQKKRPLEDALRSGLEQYAISKGSVDPKISSRSLEKIRDEMGSYWEMSVESLPNWQFRDLYFALKTLKTKSFFEGHKPKGGANNWRKIYSDYL